MSLSLLFISAGARRVLLLFSIFLLLIVPMVHAQAPEWQTVVATNRISGTSSGVVASATSAEGDVYIVGTFVGEISFGTTTITTAVDRADVFIAKWSTSGRRFVWALSAGGVEDDYATGVAVSGPNVYVSGGLQSRTATFGSITVAPPNQQFTGFVAKLVDMGSTASFKWVQHVSGQGGSVVKALAASGTSVYVTGDYGSTAGFGSTTLPNTGGYDVFVAKLLDAGDTGFFMWAQRAGGIELDTPTAIAVSGTSLYVAGYFYSPAASFGSASLLNTNTSAATSTDVFITKLTDAGTTSSFVWSQRAGGTGSDFASAIAVEGTNIYVGGVFSNVTSQFGSITLTNADASGITRDIFVAKLTDAGPSSGFTWAQRAGSNGTESLFALAVNNTSMYVAGTFAGMATVFGSTTLTNSNPNTEDIFLAKLLDAGPASEFSWAQQAGGIGSDYGDALALNGTNVYLSGAVANTASFGSQTILNPTTNRIAFLASLNDRQGLPTKVSVPIIDVRLAPNPAHATATLQLPFIPNATQVVLTLHDALGRIIQAEIVVQQRTGITHKLNLVGLAPGVYVLHVQAGTIKVVRRLVIE